MSDQSEACIECGSTSGLVEHHVSYKRDETVTLCRGCHKRVHNGDGLSHLEPEDSLGVYRPTVSGLLAARMEYACNYKFSTYTSKKELLRDALRRRLEQLEEAEAELNEKDFTPPHERYFGE